MSEGYESGEEPMVGDEVLSYSGLRGEVYNVQLNPGNSPGRAQVSVRFENATSVGNASAREFKLIKRAA
jgi:hypothetical protein